MYGNGYYPAGAEYDPCAPWNEREPTIVECAACGGHGYHWYAYDFVAGREIECTGDVWEKLPDTREEAELKGLHVIKGEEEICEVCDGYGEVEYEPDYDDYDED